MKKSILIINLICLFLMLGGCAKKELSVPCPDFGKHCQKTPINSWNFNHYQ